MCDLCKTEEQDSNRVTRMIRNKDGSYETLQHVCFWCFNEHFVLCRECCKYFYSESGDDLYCEYCLASADLSKKFVCEVCGKKHLSIKNETKGTLSYYIDCFERNNENLHTIVLCASCWNEHIDSECYLTYCSECNQLFAYDNGRMLNVPNDSFVCRKCMQEKEL